MSDRATAALVAAEIAAVAEVLADPRVVIVAAGPVLIARRVK